MPFPYVFTFYSYKGGVGRSMALLNTAYTLAAWGRHVLIVDMDLEAPGLSGFLSRRQETEPGPEGIKDVVTLLQEALTAIRQEGNPQALAPRLPSILNYISIIPPAKITTQPPRFGQLGVLHVLGADPERNYQERLAALDLKALSPENLIRLSALLHYYFKTQRFPFRPLGLEDFEADVQTPYDYVLVDSRTGITETGGLCVGPLADRLVVLTGLNDQNVEGTRSFFEEAGIQLRGSAMQPWDDADPARSSEAQPVLGPKPTLLVASPVPHGEIEFKRKRLDVLENRLHVKPISLSYHPQMALMESVFVRDYPEEFLTSQYRRLATRLRAMVGDDPDTLQSTLASAGFGANDPPLAIATALRLAPDTSDGSLLLFIASNLKSWQDLEPWPCRRFCAHLAQQTDQLDVTWLNWGNALAAQARSKSGADADRLFAEACARYEQALRIKPDKHEALNNWGNALADQAKSKSGADAAPLFAEAYAKFEDALRLKPDMHEALNNWGSALLTQVSRQPALAERLPLLETAREKLLVAERIQPGFGSYNLACIEALLGLPSAACRWLENHLQAGLPLTQARIASDTDFDAVRTDPEFVRFLSALPPE